MSLRVAFHQTPALRPRSGVGHYVAELMDALSRRGDTLHVAGIPDGLIAATYRRTYSWLGPKHAPAPRIAPSSTARSGSRLRSLVHGLTSRAQSALLWSLSRQLTSNRFDLYHEPNFPILASEVPTILTLYDLSLLLMPEHHPRSRVAAFEKQLPQALAQTAHIITISHFIRDEIIRVLGWPAERVTCTYLGVRSAMKPMPAESTRAVLASLGLPPKFLLYVGTLEPRKNLLRLMQAYCRLPSATRESCPLLLVGNWGWNVREMADYFESHARHHGVMHLGYLPEEHLGAVYNGARALVYPSLYEGFGLPPLEMMACGGAVLASTAGALREVFGNHAHLIDAADDAGWTDAMSRVIHDDDWHSQLCRESLAYASTFTWDRCARETHDVYRRVKVA